MATDSRSTYSAQLYQSAQESKALPLPGDVAQAHSETLINKIQQEMNHNVISFQRFMELALYAPSLGYYAAGSTKLGEEGDFITAPEISSLFSSCLANAILPLLKSHRDFVVLEVGAGSGRMAADVLLFLKQHDALPKNYWILELSADLRERQQQMLSAAIPEYFERVKWLDELPESFSGVVLANELLDAMPVQLFQKTENNINEVNVAWQQESFVFQTQLAEDPRLIKRVKELEQKSGEAFATGYISEVNFAAEDWVKSIADRLQQGLMLLIDYGFPQHEYYHAQRTQGTLMCHYRHRAHSDPLVYPGLQDITAHVDFTAIADASLEAGLKVTGYTNQASFLMGAGLIELTTQMQQTDLQQQIDVAQQVKKLTLPHEMGELFKVMGLSKNINEPLPAFMFRDLRESL